MEGYLSLFNALLNWRMECFKQDGVPPYVVCTNHLFGDMT